MDYLYDLRDWLFECERFLFLAEVHYRNNDVTPAEHKFNFNLNIDSLEDIFICTKKHCDDEFYCISFDKCISDDEFIFFKRTLENVLFEKWGKIQISDIIRSQEIIQKLTKNISADIGTLHRQKGYPSLNESCSLH